MTAWGGKCDESSDKSAFRACNAIALRAQGVIARRDEMTYQSFLEDTSPEVAAIRMNILRGMRVPAAMDFVLGEGSYEKFAREIYDSIRARG